MNAREVMELVAAAPDPFVAAVACGDVLPFAVRLFGTAGDVLYQNGLARDLVGDDASERAQASVVRAARAGTSALPVIQWCERPLYRRVALEHGAIAVRGPREGVLAWVCDVTRAELARKQARGCELMFVNAPDGMLVVDARGIVRRANARLCRMFGYALEELIGASVELLVPIGRGADHAKQREGYFRNPATRPMASGLRLSGRRKDGSEVMVDIALSPLDADDGPSVIAAVRDVGEARRLEAQLRQSQRLDSLGRLAGGIAHDFNNLLTVVLGYASLVLADLPDDDPRGADISAIRSAAERGAELTAKILAFARSAAATPRVVALNQHIVELEALLRPTIGEDVSLVFELDPADPKVEIDPAHLGQVLVNLVVNARDAMPKGGTITVATLAGTAPEPDGPGAETRPFATIRVTDTGVGIGPDDLAHVFDPFFSTKTPGRGTGLGLSTVRGVLQQAGGHIDVCSQPGQGSTFEVRLPRTELPATPKASAPSDVPRHRVRRTVLLVEDDENVLAATRAILRYGDLEVVVAASGAEALQTVAKYPGRIDLLLTDVVMPGMNGYELAERILADRPGIRVLLMTGYSDLPPIATPLLGQAPPIVPKPLTLQTLLSAVHQVLDAPDAGSVA